MKVLGVIPARFSSSRFPGKPLIDLKGKTMVQRVYEGAQKSKLIDELIVATDDLRIYDEVIRFGGKAIMTSKDHPSGTDRCAEVAKQFPEMDIVINVQGDEPLVDHRQLDQLINAFADQTTEIATLGSLNISNDEIVDANRIKIVINKRSEALYFSRSAIPNSNNASKEIASAYPFMRHIGLYAYRIKTLMELTNIEPTLLEKIESLEQLRWLFHGYKIKVVETAIETPNIDVPGDVQKVLDLL